MTTTPSNRTGARIVRVLGKMFRWWALFSLLSALVALVVKRFTDAEADPRAPAFRTIAVFDGVDHRPVTSALEDSRSLTVFGGTRLDLRRCDIAAGHARLRLVTVFGGCAVVVPDTWVVSVHGRAVAGGNDVRVPPEHTMPESAPTLDVDVVTVFGGVAIRARPVIAVADAG